MTLHYCFTTPTSLWGVGLTSIPDASKSRIPSYIDQILNDWEHHTKERFPHELRNMVFETISEVLNERLGSGKDCTLIIPLVNPGTYLEELLDYTISKVRAAQEAKRREATEAQILHNLMGKEVH